MVHPLWVLRLDGTYEVNPALNGEASVEVLRAEAEQGRAAAQRDLALGYLKAGFGLQTNVAEGLKWIEAAARQGDSVAEQVMGALYNYGSFVPQDVGQAARWYRQAAEHGNPVAQVALADMLQRGRGTKVDPAEAFQWLKRAASQGWPEGERLLGKAHWEGAGTPQSYVLGYWWFRKAVKHGSADAEVQTFVGRLDIALIVVSIVLLVVVYRFLRWMFQLASPSPAPSKPMSAPPLGKASIVACPNCGQRLRVRPDQRHATLRCRACQGEFQAGR